MFVRIEPHELVPGTKYKIGTAKYTYVKTLGNRYVFFDMINPTFQRFRFCTSSNTFYKFVPDNPQGKMERRSVNIIVRRLIGDEHFEW